MSKLAIEAENISKSFEEIVALDQISLSVEKGTVFGLLGPNGAGKTTTVRILNGLVKPSSAGNINILGFDLYNETQSIRQRVGVLSDCNLYERLTAIENLLLFGKLYGLSNNESFKRAKELLERFGLQDRSGDKVEAYSKGMKQKLSIARALMGDPELVYLDEPTAGLDPEASYELLQYIKELSSDSSKTFFIASHRLEEIESICDAVAILAEGKIRAYGSPQELARQVFTDCWVSVKLAPDNSGFAPGNSGNSIDTSLLVKQLSELDQVQDIKQSVDGIRIKVKGRDSIPELVRSLARLDINIYGIAEDVPSLQDAYLAIIKDI